VIFQPASLPLAQQARDKANIQYIFN